MIHNVNLQLDVQVLCAVVRCPQKFVWGTDTQSVLEEAIAVCKIGELSNTTVSDLHNVDILIVHSAPCIPTEQTHTHAQPCSINASAVATKEMTVGTPQTGMKGQASCESHLFVFHGMPCSDSAITQVAVL